jgi:hypothetical protein
LLLVRLLRRRRDYRLYRPRARGLLAVAASRIQFRPTRMSATHHHHHSTSFPLSFLI